MRVSNRGWPGDGHQLDAAHPGAGEVNACPFTAREIEVLEAMAKGLDCKEIARTLGISEHTVRKHRSNMCTRLGLRNAVELVAHARLHGWLRAARSPPIASAFSA